MYRQEDEEIKSLLDLSLVVTLLLSREIKKKKGREKERDILRLYEISHASWMHNGCIVPSRYHVSLSSSTFELEGVQTLPLPFPSSPIPPRGTINPTIRRNHAGKSFLIGR